jgi:membrane associated rhomboid family serine protease
MSQVPPPISPEQSQTPPAVPVCYRHPKREAYLRCVRCDRPICPDCVIEAPVGFQCPECVAAGRRTVRVSRTMFGGSTTGEHGYVTKALIAINTAVLVVGVAISGAQSLYGGGLGGLLSGSTKLSQAWSVWGVAQTGYGRVVTAQYRAGVADGEYYRLFTSMFVHYGLVHLALNMWALWVLGRELEARLGPSRFLTLYLVAGVGGSVACYLFTPAAQSAGASGAIYGLFGALFVVFRKLNLNTSSIITVLVINLVFSFTVPGISIAAHLGGLVTGGLIGVALAYAPQGMRNRILVASVVGFMLIFGALVALQTASLSSLPPLPPGV